MYVETTIGNRMLIKEDKVNIPPYAEVWTQPLQVAGVDVPQLAVMAEDEEGKTSFIASHSTGYRLVANQLVHQVITDLLTRNDQHYNHHTTVWNGKKLIERFFLPDVFIGDDDKVSLGIEGLNSYDGSTQFGVRFFMHRLVCTNGLYLDDALGSFMFRHINGDFDLADATQELTRGIQEFFNLAPYVTQMKQLPIDLDTVLEWHNKLVAGTPKWPVSKTGLVVQALSDGSKKNMWDLLNAFTSVTSHNMTPFSGASLSDRVCRLAFDEAKALPAPMEVV